MKSLLVPAMLCLATACSHAAPLSSTSTECPFAGEDRSDLTDWREAGFETESPNMTATDLAACLGEAEPFLRDKIGYEGFTSVLRSGAVSEETRRALINSLTETLQADDPQGFHAPFAALGLAELARTDRVESFLEEGERAALVTAAATYLAGVDDYRAFSNSEGWRHGVAHGADFAMQLSLNPNVRIDSLLELRSAVTAQFMPPSDHAFTHGEPGRLARPILFMASRGEIAGEEWRSWFESLVDPAPLDNWGDAFSSEAALIRLHNLKAFAQSLYIYASLSENPNLVPIAAGSLDLLKALP